MDMENQHISGLFQRVKAHIQKHTTQRITIIEIVFQETKIKLEENNLEVKKGTLILKNMSSLKKSELNIKKEAIQGKIASQTGITSIDIR